MEQIFHGINNEFGDKPAIGVFHSVSGVTAMRWSTENGGRHLFFLIRHWFPGRDGRKTKWAENSN